MQTASTTGGNVIQVSSMRRSDSSQEEIVDRADQHQVAKEDPYDHPKGNRGNSRELVQGAPQLAGHVVEAEVHHRRALGDLGGRGLRRCP